MAEGVHKIKTQSFEIELNNEELAYQLKDTFGDLVKQKIIQGVEKVFDELCPEDVTIKIPHLEIDLGEIDIHNIGSELEYRLRQELKKYLIQVVESIEHNQQTTDYEVITNSASNASLVQIFLESGILPWWAPDTYYGNNFEFSLFKLLAEIGEDPIELTILLRKVAGNSKMFDRLITHLDTEEMLALIKLIAAGKTDNILKVYREVSAIGNSSSFKQALPHWNIRIFWQEALKLSVVHFNSSTTLSAQVIYSRLLKAIASIEQKNFSEVLESIEHIIDHSPQTKNDDLRMPLLKKYIQTHSLTDHSGKKQSDQQTAESANNEISDKKSGSEVSKEKVIQVSGELLSLDEIKSRWLLPLEKVKWVPKLRKHDLLNIISLKWPSEIRLIEQLYEEARQLILKKYWRRVSSSQFDAIYIEMVLDHILVEHTQKFEPEELINKLVQIIADKAMMPKLLVLESMISQVQFETMSDMAIQVRKSTRYEFKRESENIETKDVQSGQENGEVIKNSVSLEASTLFTTPSGRTFIKDVIRNFFLFGIYPIDFIEDYINSQIKDDAKDQASKTPSVALGEIIYHFTQKSPDTLKAIIESFTPRQMLRLVMRLQQELPMPFRRQVIEEITALRMVAPLPGIKDNIQSVKLEEVVKNREDISFLISVWYGQDSVKDQVLFKLDDLIESFLTKYPQSSLKYFESMTAVDFNMILEEVEDTLKEKLIELFEKKHYQSDEKSSQGVEVFEEEESKKGFSTIEPLFIKNAGLVILYPFLSRYFNMLGLLAEDKKGFKGKHEAQRAVRLLHFLVSARKEGKEYEMTLNKIISGVPFEVPLEKDLVLTNKEIETSESLLNGVIQNWSILKNSSIDNLRGSFLIRDGRLEETEKAWILKVEQKGFDVLIDKIPWSFNLIKFPWMNKPIHVDWR